MHRWLDAAGFVDPELRRCYIAAGRRLGAEYSPQLADFGRWAGLIPAALRPYEVAIASMVRSADLRADSGDPKERLRRIDEYEESVLAAITAGHSDEPVLHAVAHTFNAFGMRTCYLKEVYGAMRRDAVFTPFTTYDELRRWAEASTGASFMAFGPMFWSSGTLAEIEPKVRALGAAIQLADNLQDLAEDLRNGRMYLPLEDLERFGVTQDDLFQGRWSPAVAELVAFEVARVRGVDQMVAELQRWTYPSLHLFLRTWARGIEMILDEVMAAGPLLLRRSPPMRRYRWFTAIFPEGVPGDVARGEVPSPSARGLNGSTGPKPPAAQRAPAAIAAELQRWVKSDGTWLGLLCRDALFPPGNLLRPVLCLESALATGGTRAEVLPFAAGLECLHAASLVHDQLLDKSPTRRSQAALPHRSGFEDLLLGGDALFGNGFLAMLGAWEDGVPPERMLPALRTGLRAAEAACRAALLESTLRGDMSADPELCLEVIRGKTAASMQAACAAGGLLAGAPPEQVQALGRYGEALGMALQIRDEVLSLTSDPHPMGNVLTSDIENRQPPLPVLLAHALAGDTDRSRLAEAFSSSETSRTAHRELGARLARTGVLEEAARRARAHAIRAREALAELPPSESRDRLAALVTRVMEGQAAPDGTPARLRDSETGSPERLVKEGPAAPSLLAAIEAELHRWVKRDGDRLSEMCCDALFPAGKLLRPVLCLESALVVGGAAREVLPFAAGIECIHAASLIHDDLLDQDEMRRGRESLPHRYGREDAMLAGDGLLAKGALAMIGAWEDGAGAERLLAALRVVAHAMKEACRAAMLESMLRNDVAIDLALSLEVSRGKTAVLMRAACESGGILAGAASAQVQALGRYGEALGMAFQIRDDLLPYTSDTRTIGKAITSDANNRYPTLPILLAQSLSGDSDRRRLQELFSSTEDVPAIHHEMSDLLFRTGAIAEATRRAREYAACAHAALGELPPSESRDRLAALVTTVVDRDR
jgi:geranylgeranyl pyrophosphate synthase/phytoene/squalene synthetase